ncbi:hypothetical protein H5410_062591 [Solanum commersonii]|uniref:Uncharacterized protein n=1 Tax=Solanum commersonii TaxID=4109 RepID=A0A9J5WB36_SOLCO|nr:hypothetical protein H5410_062591 [Solanum commersonii]
MFTKNNKGSSAFKSKFPLVKINTDEFTHVNETSFSRLGLIEINSDTPIIFEKVYERHYDNYQENEEVEIDEEVDLYDTPTSPDLNSTEIPAQEDNLLARTSRLPIVPTRGKTKVQRTLKSNWFPYLSSLGVCENSSGGALARGSNMVQGELNTSNSSGPLTHQTYNKNSNRENFAKMIVVCGLPFSFGEYPGLTRSMVKRYIFEFQEKYYQFLRLYFEIMDCRVVITTDMGRSPNDFDYLISFVMHVNFRFEKFRNIKPITMQFNNHNVNPEFKLNDSDWDEVNELRIFLKSFYDATKVFSRMYYPTIFKILIHICEISSLFYEYKTNELFTSAIEVMITKFKKYFFHIPQIYLTTILFNSEYKKYGVKALIECIYQNLDIKLEEQPDLITCQNSIKLLAKEMYDKYYSLDNDENPQMSMP